MTKTAAVLIGCCGLLAVGAVSTAAPPDICEIDPVTQECIPIDPCDVLVPPEVTTVTMPDTETLDWNNDICSDDFNVYRGSVHQLRAGVPPRCHGDEIAPSTFNTPENPEPYAAYFYIVTTERGDKEGTPGFESGGTERSTLGSCDAVMRNHVLDRTAYGWNEWTRDRIDLLGLAGYITEQLDPSSISEGTNIELNSRLTAIEPPETIQELQAVDLVKAVYARRQLEQATTLFWVNHFNTEYRKTNDYFFFFEATDPARRKREATKLHYEEMEKFRAEAFSGTFYDIAEVSMLSPSMIVYLDTRTNTASGPNENYARELLELYTMGVDGGYTDEDVVQLAKVFSGWTLCRKDQPGFLTDCIDRESPLGEVVADFESANHDCNAKTLFLGTPHQVDIPDTCATPDDGVNDAFTALAGIVAHPSTKQFISKKLLQKFVTEQPSTVMIDDVVAAWNSTDPEGSLPVVMQAVFDQTLALDPDATRNKVKTPFEHMTIFRATRGETDGLSTVRSYLTRMQHLLHENPVPTGYSELGGKWIDTNNTLERQNLAAAITTGTSSTFGSDLIQLINDNGISTTVQANAEAIVEFLADVAVGGALTPADKLAALVFLTTDDAGVVSNFDDTRIRETAAFMLGLGPFQEQ